MQIVAIGGSLRRDSFNTKLLQCLQSLAPKDIRIEIEIESLRGIPLYDGDEEDRTGKPQAVQDLDAKIRAAQGVIIATPEYNFSVPGVLKNALDWLSRQGSPLRWKPVGIMGASTGPVGTARAQYHLRQTLQHHEALLLPKPEIFVRNAQTLFSKSGELTDSDTGKHVASWLVAFAAWVEKRP
jgi:chromate reductase, NAD(P)H dehydrogenase (quinone)